MSKNTAWTGWVIFAGVMLLVVGSINALQGLFGLLQSDQLVVVGNRLYVVDLTTWAWTVMIFGLLLIGAAFGLLIGKTWGRITAMIAVGLHAIAQVLWLGAYPVWSLLMIGLDTVVLYALAARWSTVREELHGEDPYPGAHAPETQRGYRSPIA